MKKHRKLVAGILLLAILGLTSFAAWRSSQRAKWAPLLIERIGGKSAYLCIAEPEKVTAQRMRQMNPDPTLAPRLGYEPMQEKFEVTRVVQSKLSRLLSDPLSYSWDQTAKSCNPNYGIKLTFYREHQHVELWVCLSCAAIYAAHGDHAGMIHFDPVEDQVVDLAILLFPGDAEIEACR